jgi:hypothetical protein
MAEFDATAILSTPMSEAGAQGKKTLLPEGTYTNCLIKEITSYPPSEDQDAKGIKARLHLRMETPDHPEPINGYVNIKDAATPHPKSTMFAVVNALWPDAKDRVGKTPNDWVGEVVNIMVVHDTNQNGDPYAKLNYREVS